MLLVLKQKKLIITPLHKQWVRQQYYHKKEFSIRSSGGGQVAIIGDKIYFNSGNADKASDVTTQTSTPQSAPEASYDTNIA